MSNILSGTVARDETTFFRGPRYPGHFDVRGFSVIKRLDLNVFAAHVRTVTATSTKAENELAAVGFAVSVKLGVDQR